MPETRGTAISAFITALAVAVLPVAGAQVSQSDPRGPGAHDLGYRLAPDWPIQAGARPALPPVLGISSRYQVWPSTRVGTFLVLHRGAHPILVFDSAGKFVCSWGDGMFSEGKVVPYRRVIALQAPLAYWPSMAAGCDSCGAHSVRVDKEGNIWVVDAPGHVIYKMNPQGKVIQQLGQKGVSELAPTLQPAHRCRLWTESELYVSDGYGNPRVVKYTHEGNTCFSGAREDRGWRVPATSQFSSRCAGKSLCHRSDNRRVQGV